MLRRLLSIVVLLSASVGCNRSDVKGLPSDVVGYWTTNDARYHGRFLELNRAFVIIGAGKKGSPSVQIIDRIESQPLPDGTSYTIYSTTQEGMHDQLTIEFRPANGGEIRFQHEGAVWKRSEIGNPDPEPSAPPDPQ
jgi:hypothetical protein